MLHARRRHEARKGNCRALWKALDHDFSGITTIEELLGERPRVARHRQMVIFKKEDAPVQVIRAGWKNHGIKSTSYIFIFIFFIYLCLFIYYLLFFLLLYCDII